MGGGALCFLSSNLDLNLYKQICNLLMARWRLFSLLAVAIVFVAEIYILSSAWFEAGWDVRHVTSLDTMHLDVFYFSICSNNLVLAGGFSIIGTLLAMLGINDVYLVLSIGSCLAVCASIWLVGQVAFYWGGLRLALPFLGVASLLIGMSPWVMVPYSDTFGMLFVSTALFAWTEGKGPLKWMAVAFCSVFGYLIKPTVIFVAIACALVGLASSNQRRDCRFVFKVLIAALLGGLLAISLGFWIKGHADVSIDESLEMGIPHFLMMGFNPATNGSYSNEDWLFSESFDDPDTRVSAQLQEWSNRVQKAGPFGLIKLFAKKSFSNYGSGTFSWGGEGGFFSKVHGDDSSIRSFYGIPDTTTSANTNEMKPLSCPWAGIAQIVWFWVLLGIVFVLLERKLSKGQSAACLMLLMLSVFLLLFECRSRYLLLYAPVFVLVASAGWARLEVWFQSKTVLEG